MHFSAKFLIFAENIVFFIEMLKVENKGKTSEYVYDISLDGTVVNALGLNVLSNTDGFNFKLPENFRYTEEHPYISNGASRETEAGRAYTGLDADVAEFNDIYMRDFHYAPNAVNKMGLGIDEVIAATINFSRKNYADYFAGKPCPKDIKLVGNTIKSKKMSLYIKKFLDIAIRLLLKGDGKGFIDEYYSYIDKIYNYQIPLRDIASKGSVKKSIADYKKDTTTLTKSGQSKARQAWMELAIRDGVSVSLGDTLYYINTGKSKSQGDVKRVQHCYKTSEGIMGMEKIDVRTHLTKEWKIAPDGKNNGVTFGDWVKKTHPDIEIVDEIILNCELVPKYILESDEDYFCEEGKEYNVQKYIDMFNSRISPLLVCFKKSIREHILITNPRDRQYFSDEDCELISGEPNKPADQDTYEALMAMTDKEVEFWMRHPEWDIPFLKECDIDWNKVKAEHIGKENNEKLLGIDKIRDEFSLAIMKLSEDDWGSIENNSIPESLTDIADYNEEAGCFVSKEHPDIVIFSIGDLLEIRTNMLEIN